MLGEFLHIDQDHDTYQIDYDQDHQKVPNWGLRPLYSRVGNVKCDNSQKKNANKLMMCLNHKGLTKP